MKKNYYFENVFDNQFNHCWLATRHKKGANCSVWKWVSKIAGKHQPRGKCYAKMHKMYWSRQK